MIRKQGLLALFVTGLALVFGLATGCVIQDRDSLPGTTPAQGSDSPEDPEPDLSPESRDVVYPENWKDMVIMANWAKTKVTIAAHFSTSRNACGKEAYGAIALKLWNSIAKNTNIAIKKPPLSQDRCTDVPDDSFKYVDGSVEVKVADEQKPRILYENRNGQICSTIQDEDASKALLEALNQLIVIADKEECPNGWGSA